MEFRVFPYPEGDICTPFIFDRRSHSFRRGGYRNGLPIQIEIRCDIRKRRGIIIGNQFNVLGNRLPNRTAVLQYLKNNSKINPSLSEFVETTVVVPTFALDLFEATVKTFIRQVVTAPQAKKTLSSFIKRFGINRNGCYYFPSPRVIRDSSIRSLREVGIGFKAERIKNFSRIIETARVESLDSIKGIGPWSRRVVQTEMYRDYGLYPFEDLSGQKIRRHLRIDLVSISKKDPELTADLYIYCGSYLEAYP